MMQPLRGSDDANLDALFQAYRDCCPAPAPSANFMPQLWSRIEARQRYSTFFGRLVAGFVTVAVAASLAMTLYLSLPRHVSAFYAESYVEALASANPLPDTVDTEPFHVDSLSAEQ